MVLDLVKDLSAKSWVSKRLWRTFSALKEVAPKVTGSMMTPSAAHDDHLTDGSSTGLSMGSGTARPQSALHPISMINNNNTNNSPYPRPTLRSAPVAPRPGGPYAQHAEAPVAQSANGVQLMMEMRRVFDVYIGGGSGGPGKVDLLPSANSLGRFVEENVFHHFKELV